MHDGNNLYAPRQVWGVAALLQAVSDSIQARFTICTVTGEISGFTRASSGHCYFSLKDADGASALLRCAMFRRAASLLDFTPSDGQRVELRARVAVYEARGELQLTVEAIRRVGEGALYEQFLRLRAKLEAQGWFDPSRKRELPAYPQKLGLVTSLDAAALHDVLVALKRRAAHVGLVVYPCLVQGADAPASIIQALAQANARAEVDLLLVCRGGGSLEDLWSFNDERVVQAIANSELPVLTGIGHETDITLADLAADVRAPTPTAAAEMASPAQAESLQRLSQLEARLQRAVRQRLDNAAQQLDRLGLRMARPADALGAQSLRLQQLQHRLARAVEQVASRRCQIHEQLAQRLQRALHSDLKLRTQSLRGWLARLETLAPEHVLARGYVLLRDERGRAVTRVEGLRTGQTVAAQLVDGIAQLQVLGSQVGIATVAKSENNPLRAQRE